MGVEASRQFLVSSLTLFSPTFVTPPMLISLLPFTFSSIMGIRKRPASTQALHGFHTTCCKTHLHLLLEERLWWPCLKQKSSTSLCSLHNDLECVLLDSFCECYVRHHEDLNKVRLVFWWIASNGKSLFLSVLLWWLSLKQAQLILSVIPGKSDSNGPKSFFIVDIFIKTSENKIQAPDKVELQTLSALKAPW